VNIKRRIAVISAVVCAFILVTAACTVYYMTRLSPNAVLMYHCIAEPPEGADSDLYVSPEQFEALLAAGRSTAEHAA